MNVFIEEIKDQILKEREVLMILEKDPTVTEKSIKKQLVERKIDMLRHEAYEIARKTDHPCPMMLLYFGEHEAKYGIAI